MTTAETAGAVFGDQHGTALRYAEWLVGAGIERGLIGPREADRIWERHLLNSAVLAGVVPGNAEVVDLGSGAGLPGIPLLLARPDLGMTLLEPLLRRATFLEEVVQDLGLPATVLRARAEEARLSVDVVVARAVAPLDRLARWSRPLLKPGGLLIALKGGSAAAEIRDHERALAQLGAAADVAILDDAVGQAANVVTVRFDGVSR